jgi:hypothetical protein
LSFAQLSYEAQVLFSVPPAPPSLFMRSVLYLEKLQSWTSVRDDDALVNPRYSWSSHYSRHRSVPSVGRRDPWWLQGIVTDVTTWPACQGRVTWPLHQKGPNDIIDMLVLDQYIHIISTFKVTGLGNPQDYIACPCPPPFS